MPQYSLAALCISALPVGILGLLCYLAWRYRHMSPWLGLLASSKTQEPPNTGIEIIWQLLIVWASGYFWISLDGMLAAEGSDSGIWSDTLWAALFGLHSVVIWSIWVKWGLWILRRKRPLYTVVDGAVWGLLPAALLGPVFWVISMVIPELAAPSSLVVATVDDAFLRGIAWAQIGVLVWVIVNVTGSIARVANTSRWYVLAAYLTFGLAFALVIWVVTTLIGLGLK